MSKHKINAHGKRTIVAVVTFALAILCSIFIVLFCKKSIVKNNHVYVSDCLFAASDGMEKYRVYVSANYVIVENKEEPEKFYFKEWIYYSTSIEEAYLCTKEREKAYNEEDAYLYVALGEIGEWWADPFGNLNKDEAVENEYIPNEIIDELKQHIHINGGYILSITDDAGYNELSEDEIKRIAPEVYDVVYDEEAVIQDYYEVDFDNDGMKDIVVNNLLGMGHGGFCETYFYRQTADGQYNKTFQINSSGRATRFFRYEGINYLIVVTVVDYRNVTEQEYDYEFCDLYYFQDGYPQETVRLTPEENQINITVRKRFVNDFINISEGNR